MTKIPIKKVAQAPIPTRFGEFELHVFQGRHPQANPDLSSEHIALVLGEVKGGRGVPVRVHSECLTSEVFGSLKCDCKEQLEQVQERIANRGIGVIVYLRQEGRGIGLANKIRAYALQAQGADTVEANEMLHLPVDARQYDIAAAILDELGVESIELLTNNPAKVEGLTSLGVEVVKRSPVVVAANQFSRPYLEAKKNRMEHELPSAPHNSAEPQSGPRSESGSEPLPEALNE